MCVASVNISFLKEKALQSFYVLPRSQFFKSAITWQEIRTKERNLQTNPSRVKDK